MKFDHDDQADSRNTFRIPPEEPIAFDEEIDEGSAAWLAWSCVVIIIGIIVELWR